MAKDRYLWFGTLCYCAGWLFLVNGIITSDSDKEKYYYNADPSHYRTEHSLHIEFLKSHGLHSHQKRDVESTATTLTTPVFPPDPNEKVSNWFHQIPTKQPESFPTKPTIHNLGVNGTGQRKNITIVKQHPDLLHNISNSVNSPAKITPLDDLGIPQDWLPEDVGVGDEVDKHDLKDEKFTSYKTDSHIFYNSTIINDPEVGKSLWVDMKTGHNAKINELLSSSHRRAATVKLSFEFPFYGHYIKNVTIATGGFLYTGHFVHSWLAATQYVAPLMANFDTGLSNNSHVQHVDNGTAFTVEWERVKLQDRPDQGEFTFQATLHKNGDIVFVYKSVPLLIKEIDDEPHPVKVGVSDAYILDRTVFYVRRKTIYEYHRVTFKKEEVKNWTTIHLTALPTCLDMHNCSSCVSAKINLNCIWCPRLNRCSTGQDRNRQYWVDNGCEVRNVTTEGMCPSKESTMYGNHSLNYDVEQDNSFDRDYIGHYPLRPFPPTQLGASGYVAIIFLIATISGFAFWTVYAYRNPHSASGQMLIRYRPSQWRWRRGEARYTAATIHM